MTCLTLRLHSMICLFRSPRAGWGRPPAARALNRLTAIWIRSTQSGFKGDCGTLQWASSSFVSYIIISFLIAGTHIAIIWKTPSVATEESRRPSEARTTLRPSMRSGRSSTSMPPSSSSTVSWQTLQMLLEHSRAQASNTIELIMDSSQWRGSYPLLGHPFRLHQAGPGR